MAKDPDHLADNFEPENTGGVLSGFLAEEDEFDRRALWRLGSWGVASVGAVIIAVLANQSSIGLRREQVAAVELAQQSQQIQSLAKQSQSEARRLASAIDTLNGDRDRLYTRVTVLEQGLDSVTGSIAKQASKAENSKVESSKAESSKAESSKAESSKAETSKAEASKPEIAKADKADNAKPALPQTAAASVPAATGTADLPAVPQNAPSAPAVAPVTTAAAATVEKRSAPAPAVAAVTEPAPATVASISQGSKAPAPPSAAAPTPAAASPAPASPVSPMEWKSITAPPDPAAAKLIEANTPPKTLPKTVISVPIPEVVASAPPAAEAEGDEAKQADVAVQRTEFGVDVGGANSVGGLRALWRGLLKSRSNAALTVLRPIIVVKENNSGLGMQLRLVAGPLADAAAAAKICATLVANQRPCETTIFEGQRLAMNPSDQPAPARPAPVRRHFAPKHVVVNDEPQKPEPSTFDRIFHRN